MEYVSAESLSMKTRQSKKIRFRERDGKNVWKHDSCQTSRESTMKLADIANSPKQVMKK